MASMQCATKTSIAKLFVQLSQRCPSRGSRPPALDFLLPSQNIAHPQSAQAWSRPLCTISDGKPSTWTEKRRVSLPNNTQHRTHKRAFSSSSFRCATHTIFNPQKDEDGNEMKLEITPRAAKVSHEYFQHPHRQRFAKPGHADKLISSASQK